ncbi:hypothetical protein I4I78_26655, partial [Pseudonocardia sp. KRD-291]|nr:hypothetical protein [Pseudonocardia sp. KRD291]
MPCCPGPGDALPVALGRVGAGAAGALLRGSSRSGAGVTGARVAVRRDVLLRGDVVGA